MNPFGDPSGEGLELSGADYERAHRACREALVNTRGIFNESDFIDNASRYWLIGVVPRPGALIKCFALT